MPPKTAKDAAAAKKDVKEEPSYMSRLVVEYVVTQGDSKKRHFISTALLAMYAPNMAEDKDFNNVSFKTVQQFVDWLSWCEKYGAGYSDLNDLIEWDATDLVKLYIFVEPFYVPRLQSFILRRMSTIFMAVIEKDISQNHGWNEVFPTDTSDLRSSYMTHAEIKEIYEKLKHGDRMRRLMVSGFFVEGRDENYTCLVKYPQQFLAEVLAKTGWSEEEFNWAYKVLERWADH